MSANEVEANSMKLGAKNVKAAERASVSYAGLVEEFGEAEGEAKYNAIASIPVGDSGVLYFDPKQEKNYKPDLAVASLIPSLRTEIAEIIKTKQAKE